MILLKLPRHFQARETPSEYQEEWLSCRAHVTCGGGGGGVLAPFRPVVFYFRSQSRSAEA